MLPRAGGYTAGIKTGAGAGADEGAAALPKANAAAAALWVRAGDEVLPWTAWGGATSASAAEEAAGPVQ